MDEGHLRYGSAQGRWVLLATIGGSAMALIDSTIVNVALPAMGRSFNATFTTLQWVVSAYALTLAALILVGGVLGDRLGRRRVFTVGVVWFAAASLLCGLAPSAPVLIGARAVQGVGAALLTPGSLAILQSSFAPADRARAIGAWTGLGGVAAAVGPLVGGWLVDVASWRWAFLINVPIAALVLGVTLRHVPESRPAPAGTVRRPDVAGAVLGALALGGLSYALIGAGDEGFTAGVVLAAAVGLAAGAAFVVVERRSPRAMLPPSVFASRQFVVANVVTFVVYAGMNSVFLLLVVELQVVAGYRAVAAGLALLPTTLLMLAGSARSGALAGRIGPRVQMSLGPVVMAAGIALLTRIGPDAPYLTQVLPGVAVFGLGLTAMVAPLTATALATAPPGHAGLASGVNNAVARTGGLVAVSAVPALAGLAGRVYDDPAAFDHGFGVAMWISAATVLAGGLLAGVAIRSDALEGAPRA